MHRSLTATAVIAFGLLLSACDGPLVLLPGGALEGDVAPTPDGWAFTDDISTIQLETHPAEPYSVNIWVVALDDALYVHAGANRATWIEHMERDPNVRLQAEAALYELSAARVTEQAEFDRFSDAYQQKYGTRPRNENVDEAYLFRLTPR